MRLTKSRIQLAALLVIAITTGIKWWLLEPSIETNAEHNPLKTNLSFKSGRTARITIALEENRDAGRLKALEITKVERDDSRGTMFWDSLYYLDLMGKSEHITSISELCRTPELTPDTNADISDTRGPFRLESKIKKSGGYSEIHDLQLSEADNPTYSVDGSGERFRTYAEQVARYICEWTE